MGLSPNATRARCGYVRNVRARESCQNVADVEDTGEVCIRRMVHTKLLQVFGAGRPTGEYARPHPTPKSTTTTQRCAGTRDSGSAAVPTSPKRRDRGLQTVGMFRLSNAKGGMIRHPRERFCKDTPTLALRRKNSRACLDTIIGGGRGYIRVR